MSFTRLLAVGRSIMGIRPQPSPYRMNEDHLLPKFAPLPRPVLAALPARPQPNPPGTGRPLSAPLGGAGVGPVVMPGRPAGKKRGSALSRLAKGLGWLMWWRRGAEGAVKTSAGSAIQTELSLNAVKVVRNDLIDGDLPGLSAGRLSDTKGSVSANAGRRPLGMVWNRLSARLLRQAAQEFNTVQKERGKFLSQAGDGSGGARRS